MRCPRKALRPGCNNGSSTTKPPNASPRFHRACVTFCLSHICLCHFVTTLACLHTRLFSTHTEYADHWGPSSHGNEASVNRVLVEIIVISLTVAVGLNNAYLKRNIITCTSFTSTVRLVSETKSKASPLWCPVKWCSDSHSWRRLDKNRKGASRVTIVMENSTTYFCCLGLANKKSTQYGPGGYLTACWVLACDLLITFASIMNLWHQFLCRFCYLKHILPLCEQAIMCIEGLTALM